MSKALKILSRPKGNAEEYGRWSVNPYIGCSNNCGYCFLKKGPSGAYLGQDKPVLKKGVVNEEHAYHLAMAEIIANRDEIIRDGGLFVTFTSDPCAKETRDLFFRIVADCAGYRMTPKDKIIPCTLLTKCADFCGYDIEIVDNDEKFDRVRAWDSHFGLFSPEIFRDRLAIGFTLTGHDELEPNASPNAERIKAMKWLSERKYNVWASIEPIIDFPSALDMVYQALNAGCQHFKIGLLTNNTRVCRDKYDVNDCLHFIEDVMRMTADKATVYWKQSVRDLLGPDLEFHIDIDEHSVDKDWSMFNHK